MSALRAGLLSALLICQPAMHLAPALAQAACTGENCLPTQDQEGSACEGRDCMPMRQGAECKDRDCMPAQDDPVRFCEGQDCAPAAANPVDECEGEDCVPTPVQ